ncbi:MAG: hypothetical protein KIS92_20340 [Planctomycetota bacterium]|nr:hypothetical protein [Planctomycetota bacterium]
MNRAVRRLPHPFTLLAMLWVLVGFLWLNRAHFYYSGWPFTHFLLRLIRVGTVLPWSEYPPWNLLKLGGNLFVALSAIAGAYGFARWLLSTNLTNLNGFKSYRFHLSTALAVCLILALLLGLQFVPREERTGPLYDLKSVYGWPCIVNVDYGYDWRGERLLDDPDEPGRYLHPLTNALFALACAGTLWFFLELRVANTAFPVMHPIKEKRSSPTT